MFTERILAQFNGIVAIAGFYTDDDGFHHVIVATGDGNLHEVYFTPQGQVFQDVLKNIFGINHLAGFFASDDKNRIVLVATNDGNIHEVFFKPSTGLNIDILTHFEGIVSIAGFYTPDDSYRHVIVATSDGNIWEVYYHPNIGVRISNQPLKNIAGVVSVAGYYIPSVKERRVFVASADGNLRFLDYSSAIGVTPGPILQHFNSLVTATSFYTPQVQDISQTTVVAAATTTDGNIHAIIWTPPPPPPTPPKIGYLKAAPDAGYVNLGQPANLSWSVTNAHADTKVSLQGHIGLEGSGQLVLNLPNVPLQGSQNVVPTDDTKYTLTVTDSTGQISQSVWVKVYAPPNPPTGSPFYFKMTNLQSQVTPCFTIAVYAQDEATAKSMAEQENGGYTATSIDASQFATACG